MLRVLRGFFMSVFVAACVVGACSSCSGGGSGSVGSQFSGGSKYGPEYGSKYGPEYGSKYGPEYGSKYGPEYGPEYGSKYGSKYGPEYGSKYGSEYGEGKIDSSLKSIKERGHDHTATIKDDPDLIFREPNPRVVPVEDGDVYPGMKFYNAVGGYCTMGPIFLSPDGRRHGVTAGHCAIGDDKSQDVFLEDGRVFGVVVEKSDAYKEKYKGGRFVHVLSDNVPDYAFIDIDPSMKVSFKVNKSLVVDYVADGRDAVKLLPKACTYGATTRAKKCGSVQGGVSGTAYLDIGIWCQPGDSGSPIIIQTHDGRTAYIGVTSLVYDLVEFGAGQVIKTTIYSIFDHIPSDWVIPR